MKNAKWMLSVTLMLVSGVMAAQSLTNSHVVAQVPFDFMVNNKYIPAGECVIRAADKEGEVLAIRNFDARKSALAGASHAETKEAADSTLLVFKRYGGQYFLSESRLECINLTSKLPAILAEREL